MIVDENLKKSVLSVYGFRLENFSRNYKKGLLGIVLQLIFLLVYLDIEYIA